MSRDPRADRLVAVTLTEAAFESLAALEAAHGWVTAGSASQLVATLRDPVTRVVGLLAETNEAMAEGVVAGYAVVARLPFEAELQAILVDRRWRGCGLARRLLAAVVDQAREWGSERLLLEVRAGNAAAIGLYRAAGFREDGVRRGYYPPLRSGASHAPETPPPRQAGAVREDALLMSLAPG